MTENPERDFIRIGAVGDILLTRRTGPLCGRRDSFLISQEVQQLLSQCDIVFGNLECTLKGDGPTVCTEPRVVSTPELVGQVKAAGLTVVSLANNHMFDCLEAGFHEMRRILDELNMVSFGAGDCLAEATKPTIVEKNGIRLAFLAGVDELSGPSHFATERHCGVPPIDIGRMSRQICELRDQVDHVLVSLHWGEERFGIPGPVQVEQAHVLVEAGASLVLGHHPHVIQGLEMYKKVPIIYSLGNFVADDVYFTDGDVMTWTRTERTGCILQVDLTKTRVSNIRQVATHDTGRQVDMDCSGFGERRIARTNRAVAKGVSLGRYRREHLWVKTVAPVLKYLKWSKLKTLRFRQIKNALRGLARLCRMK